MKEITIEQLFQKRGGAIPAIIVEHGTGRVLMLSKMNEEAFRKSVETRKMHYWDSINDAVWLKGEHSAQYQEPVEILLDVCNARQHEAALLIKVKQEAGECLFGFADCFYRKFDGESFKIQEFLIENTEAFREYEERIFPCLSIEEEEAKSREYYKKSQAANPGAGG